MESEGSSSSLAGCQPGALEVVGSNPTDPIILLVHLLLSRADLQSLCVIVDLQKPVNRYN
jgi:hypothetical protein